MCKTDKTIVPDDQPWPHAADGSLALSESALDRLILNEQTRRCVRVFQTHRLPEVQRCDTGPLHSCSGGLEEGVSFVFSAGREVESSSRP